jgi:hypothetical protein
MPSVDVLAARYVAAAQDHARAKIQDARAANAAQALLIRAFHALRDIGDAGWASIRALTSHPDPEVRLWAATHLLQVAPGPACAALEELEALNGLVGFEASIVLEEWRAGRLTWQ